jgi:predicted Zn-ribbon and HTH transcriptional regulator
MPIGIIATLDPIQWIYSMGWGYRRAIAGGRWPLALWGMWLNFGPSAFVAVLTFASVAMFQYSLSGIVALGGTLVYGGLSVAILCRVTAAYIRHLRYDPATCDLCGYSLLHLTEPRCPECGTGFDPERLIGEFAWETSVDWTPPDTSGISEVDFPIVCDACGYSLKGLADEGRCPECGTAFDRRERLFGVYGPEAFCPERLVWSKPVRRVRSVRRAVFVTVLALVSAPLVHWLSAGGVIPPDCSLLVLLLFAVAIMEWIQASREEPAQMEPDDESSRSA